MGIHDTVSWHSESGCRRSAVHNGDGSRREGESVDGRRQTRIRHCNREDSFLSVIRGSEGTRV